MKTGWAHSNISWSLHQEYRNSPHFYQGNCNLNGENLLGTCICGKGFYGNECQYKKRFMPCTNRDDICFYTKLAGVFAVSKPRWNFAQEAEKTLWLKTKDTNDRTEEHMHDFDEYKKVAPDGSNLGVLLEIGCGPWSQSYPMIQKRNYKFDKYILLDPGIIDYSRIKTSILNKKIHPIPIYIKSPGEDISFIENTIDTLVMINVLEHVENSIKLLRVVYNALKPGGKIIFNDRWWDREGKPGNKRKLMDLDVLYHPIRLHKKIFDLFLSGFDEIYRIDNSKSWAFTKDNRNYEGTYFIGKKKSFNSLLSNE